MQAAAFVSSLPTQLRARTLVMCRVICVLIGLIAAGSASAQSDPLVDLSEAYRNRDAAAAAALYAPDAVVTSSYDNAPAERHQGTAAITDYFQAVFDQIDPSEPIDLNFRVSSRTDTAAQGTYRLRIGSRFTTYGRFTVSFSSDGRFAADESSSATLADFESGAGPVLVRPGEEDLDRRYYAQLAGRYRLSDGCQVIITRSVVRLFMRNSCTGEWRGLNRVSGREWTAGDRVRSDVALQTVVFPGVGRPDNLVLREGDRALTAMREDAYRTEEISFRSADGTELSGTIYVPTAAPNRGARYPATVMLHGSGPQDRDGYASIIAVMADELAANGRIALAYDKRGSGQSTGDGDRAGFDTLAEDALAGVRALAEREDVDPARIGLAGSSQAGWVAAKAVGREPTIADILLLGAAGSAMTVEEQNLYNTNVRMRCAGFASDDITLALDQQRAFFRFLVDPAEAEALDRLTRTASTRAHLADWLFPDSASTDRNGGQWFTVLDPQFDPRPLWRAYKGHKLFLFSQHDDATPSSIAIERSERDGARVHLLAGAQHLGLVAIGPCAAELTDVAAFAPSLFDQIARFARRAKQ